MSLKFLNTFCFLFFVSCSSYKTLYTMEDSSRPDWATEQTPCISTKETLTCVGVFQVRKVGNLNMNMVRQQSELAARSELSNRIIISIEQTISSHINSNHSKSRFHSTAKTSTNSLVNGAHVKSRWYEVIEVETEDDPLVNYYSKIEISNKEINRSIQRILKGEQYE